MRIGVRKGFVRTLGIVIAFTLAPASTSTQDIIVG
jgi:hypothetical protein